MAEMDPNQAYGSLTEGVHVAGYSLERALQKLKWLLAEGRWKAVGGGFDDVHAFIDTIKLDSLKIVAEQRKEIAVLIKKVDSEVSNRAIAKVLGVDEGTIRNDAAEKSAATGKKSSKSKAHKTAGAENSADRAPSGAAAAKIVERRTTNVETTQAKRADKEQRLGAKIAALPDAKFGVILADPEWHDEVYSEETGMNRHASRHYTTSSLDDIKARPVGDIAADDCVLFLWSTNQHLDVAIEVLRAWGFEYASHYIWRKPSIGLGYWNRSIHEVLLIGTRGNIPCPALGTQRESVIDAARGEHSAKPEEFLLMIEQYFPTLPKIELNRRGPARPGWSAWGNEADGEVAA
jgi:N6-adenosine-specific RNA methylase IME4